VFLPTSPCRRPSQPTLCNVMLEAPSPGKCRPEGPYPNLLSPFATGVAPGSGASTETPKSKVAFARDSGLALGSCASGPGPLPPPATQVQDLGSLGQDCDTGPQDEDLLEDFLDLCLRDVGVVEDWLDSEAVADGQTGRQDSGDSSVSSASASSAQVVATFAMNDSDSEEETDNMDLNDAYNFDHEHMAELLNKGASHDQLVEIALEGMADAFEQRMLGLELVELQGEGLEAGLPIERLRAEDFTVDDRKEGCATEAGKVVAEEKRKAAGISVRGGGTGTGGRLFGRALADLWRPGGATATTRAAGHRRDRAAVAAVAVAAIREESPKLEHCEEDAVPGPASLSALMTPQGDVTPPEGAPQVGIVAEDLMARMTETFAGSGNCQQGTAGALAAAGARHSSAAAGSRRASVEGAVQVEVERRRRSLAMQSVAGLAADVAALTARRHRLSVEKAGDVVEAALATAAASSPGGSSKEAGDGEEAPEKLRLVQGAMADANRRHRKSISEAVRKTLEEEMHQPPAPRQQSRQLPGTVGMATAAAVDRAMQSRIQQAVQGTYDRRLRLQRVQTAASAAQQRQQRQQQYHSSRPNNFEEVAFTGDGAGEAATSGAVGARPGSQGQAAWSARSQDPARWGGCHQTAGCRREGSAWWERSVQWGTHDWGSAQWGCQPSRQKWECQSSLQWATQGQAASRDSRASQACPAWQ